MLHSLREKLWKKCLVLYSLMNNRIAIINRFFKYLAPYRFLLCLCLLFQFTITFLRIFQLHLLRIAIDVYVLNEDFLGLLKDIVLVYLFVLCMLMLCNFLQYYFAGSIGQNIMLDLRMGIFSHLQRMTLSFFDKNPVGKLLVVATNDIQRLKPLLTEGVTDILGNGFILLGIIAYLFYQNYKLTLMICVLVLAFGFLLFLINGHIRKTTREQRSWFGRISSFLHESISGISLIKTFHQEKKQSDKLDCLNKKYEDASLHSLSYLSLTFPISTISKAMVMCFILWSGGIGVLEETLSLGTLLVFVGSVGLFFVSLQRLARTNRILQPIRASLERIFGLLDIKDESQTRQGEVKLAEFRQKIEFKNVWFAYDNDNFILENFNLEIKKGEQIGIVGYTGSGKTSIINLLTRLYEISRGAILIDGIDIRNVQKSQLRSLIGIVPQEPFLFSGSIEDNIRLENSRISSQQVRQAASYVGADEFISQLPAGFKQNVQELGSRLSTGQKQLISFARASVFNPQLIVLDEVTANVDVQTVKGIKNTLKKLKGRKTAIIIAHHLSTVREADKIVVLHMGRIREMGTHRELMQRKGMYYTLYLLQEIEDRLTSITRLVTRLTEIAGYARLHYVQNAQLARRIGEKLNLPDKQLERLETATLIYDVGKIRIPFNILTKPSSLTNEEFEVIKSHVTYGKKLAEKIEDFDDIARIVCYHHERWDGEGYLQGLKGEEIPLESRIIAVVDAYQAMISDRPFRKALSLKEAKRELLAGAGKQFDPQIVEILLNILKEKTPR